MGLDSGAQRVVSTKGPERTERTERKERKGSGLKRAQRVMPKSAKGQALPLKERKGSGLASCLFLACMPTFTNG
jgi:hypothetical protein